MKEVIECVIYFLLMAALLWIAWRFGKFMFDAVMGSDLPDYVKYLLLR